MNLYQYIRRVMPVKPAKNRLFTKHTNRRRAKHRRLGTLAAILVSASMIACVQAQTTALDVPFIATPQTVVQRMLELARTGPDDYLIDLGSGDGRIPITAAGLYGTHGLGIDLDPVRTEQAQALAAQSDVTDKVRFQTQNLFDTDLAPATVISLYLFPEINLELRPHLLALKPGTRIISHAFHMADWTPEQHEVVDGNNIYLWTVPARVQGLWRVSTTLPHPFDPQFVVRIWQDFDRVRGMATYPDEHSVPLHNMQLSGPDLQFELNTPSGRLTFRGVVKENAIRGQVANGATWQATFLP